MDAADLETVIAVPPTPFSPDGGLDLAAFERVLGRAIEGGLRALTIAGNTGEFGALSPDEVVLLARSARAAVPDETVILLGVGGDLTTAVRVAEEAAAAGVSGLMIHEPAGPFRTPDGWVRYHAAIARAVPGLAIVPYIRDSQIGPAPLAALVGDAPNVVAVKYAVPDPIRFAALVADGPPGLTWTCGLAEMWAPFFRAGGATGFTSGLAVIAPELSLRLFEQLSADDRPAALATWCLLRPFEELRARRSGAPNVPAVKEALAQLGVAGRSVRPPLSELESRERDEVTAILRSWGQGKGIAAA
jgi:4-hydroxy-tetrahydrodipicolinate synthase